MDKELLLQNYFSNSLTEKDEQLFNELLVSDSDFKAQYDFEQNLQRAIKDKEGQNLKAKLISFENYVRAEAPKPSSKKAYSRLSIAASVVMLIGLAWMGYNHGSSSKYEDLYAANIQEYPNTVFTITRGDTNESLEREAFVAYESKDYAEAVKKFNEIISNKRQPYIDFYMALSFLNLNKNDEAKELLKTVIAKKGQFEAESHWYLALLSIKEEDISSARAELKILTEAYDFNTEKATELLDKLD